MSQIYIKPNINCDTNFVSIYIYTYTNVSPTPSSLLESVRSQGKITEKHKVK